jgi:hypothetical protein
MGLGLLTALTGAGAGMGIISTFLEGQKEQENLQRQKETAWQQYLLGKEYSDTLYGINKTEAQIQALIAENRLRQGLDANMGQFNDSLLAQAYGVQDARISTASQTGASLDAEGASGTRGNEAPGLMRAYAEQGLKRSIDMQDRQNQSALSGMLTQAGNALFDIDREKASWEQGGYRYLQKDAQDMYNLKTAQLGQSEFDWQKNQSQPGVFDYLSSTFGGGMSGINLYSGLRNFSNFFDLGKDKETK